MCQELVRQAAQREESLLRWYLDTVIRMLESPLSNPGDQIRELRSLTAEVCARMKTP